MALPNQGSTLSDGFWISQTPEVCSSFAKIFSLLQQNEDDPSDPNVAKGSMGETAFG